MKHTTNYNLNKIELTDSPPDITALNPNFDTIDAQLKSLADKDAEIVASINTVKNNYLPKTGGNITNALKVKNKTVAVSVNGATADANGNITIDVGGDVQSVNGVQPDSNGNVVLDLGGDVQSVDGVEPDAKGNVALNASTRDEILEATKRVTDVEPDAEVAVLENLQTSVARVESNLDAKLPTTTTHIVETWREGSSWYRKWSDGWIEQGGCFVTTTTTSVVTFPLAFSNTNYFIKKNRFESTDGTESVRGSNFYNETTTSATTYTATNKKMSWYACGY